MPMLFAAIEAPQALGMQRRSNVLHPMRTTCQDKPTLRQQKLAIASAKSLLGGLPEHSLFHSRECMCVCVCV
jgi:hypothetical protein